MRLWHPALIKALPRQQLLGQHRECCALRGNGWGKRHSTVDYVFRYSPMLLYWYHYKVMNVMTDRGYSVAEEWLDAAYRGKNVSHTLISQQYYRVITQSIMMPIFWNVSKIWQVKECALTSIKVCLRQI